MSTTDAIAVHGMFTIFRNCIVYKHERGSLVVPSPILFFSAKQMLRFFSFYNQRGSFAAKRFYQEHGLTPTQFMEYSNKLMREYFPIPYDLFVLMYRGRKASLQTFWYHRYKENDKVYDQIIQDRLYNLIPIVLIFGKTPHELKKFFGKGLWKVLSNNSKSKNKLIMEVCYGYRELDIKMLALISKLNTTVLKVIARRNHIYELDGTFVEWVVHAQKYFSTKSELAQWLDVNDTLIIDTYTMASQEGVPFNTQWGPKRIVEEHNRLSRQIAMKKYSDKTIKWFESVPKTVLEHGDWIIELLCTPLDIAQEGMCMKHCVTSYIPRVQRGTYAVFSLQQRGIRYATIGLKSNNYTWVIDQVKGPRNSDVKELGFDLLDMFIMEARRMLPQPQTYEASYSEDEICF